ncbi:MAG: FAD-dependent oxidoreductase [Dehalococcoidia bacterium]|nr:FAD-dependent oxidoreductase [Dehalococcoidia bacterium]
MGNFKYLFSPTKIGALEVPNRIFMSPHHIFTLPPGSDAQIGYFEARAKGGVGTLAIANCPVVPTGLFKGFSFELFDRNCIPGLSKLIAAIHKWGAKAIVQGTWFTGAPGQAQPSGLVPQSLWTENQGRTMTIDEIRQVIKWHAIGAETAREAGADGIDFPMGGGAGLQCFSSPLYNKRTDEYGGSMENRLRAVFEIIDGVRERCGRDFAIGFQTNVDESIYGGITLEEGVEMCKMLADTGKVDYFRVGARGQKPQTTYFHYPSSYMPQGTNLYAAAAVREAIDNVTIISGGRITTAEFAEQALAEGQCDMIVMARSLIADPEWANKSKRGDTEEIRACIGDVEGCFLRSRFFQPIGCTVNPEVGQEHKPTPTPADKKKKVVIAGGGVAGMEAAMVASQRGHNVILLEQAEQLGGHVRLEAQLPGLGDRSDVVRWLSLQLKKRNVDIRLNTEATPENIAALHPDAVIVATVATYSRLGITPKQMYAIPGADAEYVLTPEDVVLSKKPVGQRVVIYDTTAYVVGPGIAEMLADQGKDVTVVSIDPKMGRSVSDLGIDVVIGMRVLPKATFIPNTAFSSIDDHTVHLMNQLTFQPSAIENVDTVILVTSKPPVEALYHSLLGKVPELHIIGDARESRANIFGIDDAIKDGKRVGLLL